MVPPLTGGKSPIRHNALHPIISARLSRTDGYTASVSGSRADRSDLWRSEWDHDHCSWSRGSGNADTRCLRGHQWRPGRADVCRESSSSLRGSTALGRIGLIVSVLIAMLGGSLLLVVAFWASAFLVTHRDSTASIP